MKPSKCSVLLDQLTHFLPLLEARLDLTPDLTYAMSGYVIKSVV